MKTNIAQITFTMSLLILVACTSNENKAVEPQKEAQEVTRAKPVKSDPSLCGSAPIIRDKSKIEQSLRTKGTITPEMSQQKSDELVKEFIQNKNDQYQRCIKGKK
jgi:uncharacterized protein YcfL